MNHDARSLVPRNRRGPFSRHSVSRHLGAAGRNDPRVLSVSRQTAEPLTARDIALEMLVTRALDRSDQRDHPVVLGPGQFMLWEVAR